VTDFALSRQISIGEQLSQSEVDEIFDANFGYQFKGITPRTRAQGKFVILMSNEGEIYDDDIGGDGSLVYEGEGVKEKGDQSDKYANSALIESESELRPIYLFTSQEGVDEYEYHGLVDVRDYEYVSDGSRMVYRFELEMLGVESWEEYQESAEDVKVSIDDSQSLFQDKTEYTENRRRVRASVFRREVKRQYENTCVVCGRSRYTPEGKPEVEAAHIIPKSESGADKIRNGIALCKLHHWAFDSGWISLSDDYTVLLNDWTEQNPPDAVASFEGTEIKLPLDADKVPHPKALQAHRERHGFDS